jgi:hypothetical protein
MLLTGILVGAVILPAIVIVALRTNAAMVFFALCGGSVLVTLMGEDIKLVAQSIGKGNAVLPIAALIGMLVAPAILAIIFLRGSVSKPKMMLQLLPAIATGVVGVLLVVPLLTPEAQKIVADNMLWQRYSQFQPVALLVGVFGSLVVAAFTARGQKHEDKKKHH